MESNAHVSAEGLSATAGGQRAGLMSRGLFRTWNNLSLRKKGWIVVAVPLLAMISASVLFLLIYRVGDDATGWVRHTLQVKEKIRHIGSLLSDSIAAERGYLLTGEERFLGPYRRAVDESPAVITSLGRLVTDNPVQVQRVHHELRPLSLRYFELAKKLESPRLTKPETDQTVGSTKEVMDSIRALLASMLQEEDRLLEKRERWSAQVARLLTAGVVASVGFGLVMAFSAASLFTTGIVRRVDRLVANTERLEKGEDLKNDFWSNDEIGKLGSSFARSAQLLEQRRAELIDRNLKLQQEIVERERSELANTQILYNSIDVICTIDAGGRFAKVSRASKKLWGYEPNELTDRLYIDLVHPDDREKTNAAAAEIMSGRVAESFENRYLRKDGSVVPVTWTANWSEPLQTMFCVAHDASDRQRSETTLRKARDSAETANRAKSDFLANMSHEIRTPINGILGMTELALDTDLTHTQREYLEMVKHSADSLLSLINDILDLSKIEAGKLALESVEFDLRGSLEKTLKTLGLRAARKGLELTCRIDPEIPNAIFGDPVRLRQILINLVDNAIKFTEAGEINLDVQVVGRVNGSVRLDFSVNDTGIGIPVEKQEAIFAAFAQADGSTTRNYGGTGLGLTISSRLVEQMGGRLTVESIPGKGSTFRFTVRLHSSESSRRGPEVPERELAGLRVLVVDDSATNRRILEEILASWQMSVVVAANGPEAIMAAKQAADASAAIQLVLVDAFMPEMDGLELARRIRDDPALGDPELIVLSSAGGKIDSSRMETLRIAARLTKPVSKSELFNNIVCLFASTKVGPDENHSITEPRMHKKLRILLADDNAVNRAVARRMLENDGHDVVEALDGLRVVEAARTEEFSVILMDVQMPALDGFDATKRIRENERGKARRTPIVAMTAHALTGDKERCLEAGMDDYLAKPVARRLLLEMVQKWGAPDEIPDRTIENIEGDLLAHFDGDSELVERVGAIFAEQSPRMLDRLAAAIDARDSTALGETAHTLIGSLGALGASKAANYARELEGLAATSAFIPAEKTLTQLKNEMDFLQSRFADIS